MSTGPCFPGCGGPAADVGLGVARELDLARDATRATALRGGRARSMGATRREMPRAGRTGSCPPGRQARDQALGRAFNRARAAVA